MVKEGHLPAAVKSSATNLVELERSCRLEGVSVNTLRPEQKNAPGLFWQMVLQCPRQEATGLESMDVLANQVHKGGRAPRPVPPKKPRTRTVMATSIS